MKFRLMLKIYVDNKEDETSIFSPENSTIAMERYSWGRFGRVVTAMMRNQ